MMYFTNQDTNVVIRKLLMIIISENYYPHYESVLD